MSRQTHRTDVQVRFSDTDALGHINNAVFATWAEIARLTFLDSLGTAVQSLILAHLSIDFRRQVMVRDTVYVESWISKIGNSSMHMDQAVYANGEIAAEIRSVIVYFDYAVNRSAPMPDDFRAQLKRFSVI